MSKLRVATVDNIVTFFEEEFSNIHSQSSWDNSGKQIYLKDRAVSKVCLALDPLEQVVKQAIGRGCELLITHHPLFFAAQNGINASRLRDRIIINAIKNDLSILSYHTNLDMADDGLNAHLLNCLNADNLGVLSPEGSLPHVKISVFVPTSHAEQVLDAIADAGAGRMGNYRRCAYSSTGTGTFTPLENANPYVGSVNKIEELEETKIEMLVPEDKIDGVVAAMISEHPYEHPAYDIIRVEKVAEFGSGKLGSLKKPLSFNKFLQFLKSKLNLDTIRINMDYHEQVSEFAICSGSGASLWRDCLKHGVNLLVTGDMKHHDAVDAKQAGVCVVDIGHYESERIYMDYLAKIIRDHFDVEVFLADESPSIEIWRG